MKNLVLGAVVASSITVFAVACSKSEESQPSPQASGSSDLPCDVDTVLAQNCRKCHSSPPLFGAPMPLRTLDDLHAVAKLTSGKRVFEQVGLRIHDDGAPMPPSPNERLDAASMATLDRWIAAGAPGGAACEGQDGGSEAGVDPTSHTEPLPCTPDQLLRPASAFSVPNTSDLYVCYGFDTNAASKRHVVSGAPHIDNAKVVHHVLLYQSETSVSSTPQPCPGGGSSDWRLVTGWAPGGKNFELPPEAGFAEDVGTTHWVLQIHYNNALALEGQVDASGYDLCSSDQLRPNDADILATGTLSIQIPPRSTSESTCDLTFPEAYGPIKVTSSWAHMHRLGRAEYAKRIRNGVETVLLDAPAYDFSTGAGAQAANVDVVPGDTIRTMCRWQNGGDSTVTFGEATSDEMCFAFLTYYPKITSANFHWFAPSLPTVSRCTVKTE